MSIAAQDDRPLRWRLNFDLGPTYNRVETIPVSVGPQIELRGDNPLRFDGRFIVRLGDLPVELERVGFRARAEKFLFGGQRFRVGLAGWEEVKSIEDRGLFNLETSLATFVFRDDRRDYFRAAGGAAYAVFSPPESPWLFGLQFSADWQKPVDAGDAPSIFDNRQVWRFQPLASEGRLDAFEAAIHYDTRPDQRDDEPFNAWWARLEFTQGIGGTLVNLPTIDPTDTTAITGIPAADQKQTFGSLDLRRYNEIRDIGINARAVFGGALTKDALSPQFQHAPGGDGTLPGYPLLSMDCGARDEPVEPERPTLGFFFYPNYGCDQYLLFQVEVVGYFGFRVGRDRSDNPWEAAGFNFQLVPQWALFFDAAKAWASTDPSPYTRRDEPWRYDVGAGLLFGDLGIYGEYPLAGDDKVLRGVLRIGRRI